MRGFVIGLFGLVSVLFFSVCVFLSGDLLFVWLYMELASIGLIPCFFVGGSSGVYLPLFGYVLVSCLSSSLIVSGFFFEDCLFFSYLGLSMKFGVFPFVGWVYLVYSSSNWLVIWCLSTVLKLPVIIMFFCLGYNLKASGFVNLCCSLTVLLVSFLFWINTFSWKHYWCHISLSSSAVLFLMSSSLTGLDRLVMVFGVYLVWCVFASLLLCGLRFFMSLGSITFFLLSCVMVSYPVSLSIFYKVFVGLSVYSCGWLFLFFWVICGISEQFYLLMLFFSNSDFLKDWGGGSSV